MFQLSVVIPPFLPWNQIVYLQYAALQHYLGCIVNRYKACHSVVFNKKVAPEVVAASRLLGPVVSNHTCRCVAKSTRT